MSRLPSLHRRVWSGCLIGAFLFLQLASAAYSCPRLADAAAVAAVETPAALPCAQAMAHGGPMSMDAEQPGLCLEHCKGGSQTLEPGTTGAGVVPPAPVALFVVPMPFDASDGVRAWQAQWQRRDPASPPPHTLLHCCFRL